MISFSGPLRYSGVTSFSDRGSSSVPSIMLIFHQEERNRAQDVYKCNDPGYQTHASLVYRLTEQLKVLLVDLQIITTLRTRLLFSQLADNAGERLCVRSRSFKYTDSPFIHPFVDFYSSFFDLHNQSIWSSGKLIRQGAWGKNKLGMYSRVERDL